MENIKERNKLIEDNHNLIYGFCLSHKLDIDKWYGILAEQLVKCADYYDTYFRSSFSNFFYVCAGKEVAKYINKEKAQRVVPSSKCISYDIQFNCSANDNTTSLADILPDNKNNLDAIIDLKDTLEIAKKILKPNEYDILYKYSILGYTHRQIAEVKGCSRAYIHSVFKKSVEHLKKVINYEN